MLPTFLVIGAMKSGTSSLARMLSAHPHVFMSQPKELHYFVAERSWSRGQQWYEEQFAPGAGYDAVGEASVTYTQAPVSAGVPARLAATLPDARLIYLVRHPVERMLSHYRHALASGDESRAPERAFRARSDYFSFSCYAQQLSLYTEHFPASQIRVVPAERYFAEPKAVLPELYRFIGVDPSIPPPPPRINATNDKQAPVGLVRKLRSLPGADVLVRHTPVAARTRVARHLPRRPIGEQNITLPPDVRAEWEERLQPDVSRLRGWMNHGFDGWGIA